jgi:hypothetical protein
VCVSFSRYSNINADVHCLCERLPRIVLTLQVTNCDSSHCQRSNSTSLQTSTPPPLTQHVVCQYTPLAQAPHTATDRARTRTCIHALQCLPPLPHQHPICTYLNRPTAKNLLYANLPASLAAATCASAACSSLPLASGVRPSGPFSSRAWDSSLSASDCAKKVHGSSSSSSVSQHCDIR